MPLCTQSIIQYTTTCMLYYKCNFCTVGLHVVWQVVVLVYTLDHHTVEHCLWLVGAHRQVIQHQWDTSGHNVLSNTTVVGHMPYARKLTDEHLLFRTLNMVWTFRRFGLANHHQPSVRTRWRVAVLSLCVNVCLSVTTKQTPMLVYYGTNKVSIGRKR